MKMEKPPRQRESISHHHQDEIRLAEDEVLRIIQKDSLAKTIWEVKHNEAPTLHNPLAQYNPRLDECGLLKVSAPLRSATHLPEGAREPIQLHKTHPTTRTLMETIHRHELKHMGGPKYLLAEFNLHYFTH